MTKPKICTDCAYSKLSKYRTSLLCTKVISENEFLVGLGDHDTLCTIARMDYGDCGKDGKLFVPKAAMPSDSEVKYTFLELMLFGFGMALIALGTSNILRALSQ